MWARNLAFGDRERHGPGRIEIDRGDEGGERRRRLVDFADNDAVAPLDLVVADRLDERGRNVHHHVALGENEIHAEQTLERGFELFDALGDRYVQRFQRPRVDAAGGLKPVTQLEPLDGVDDGGVVSFALLLLRCEIVGDHEMPAQQCDSGPGRLRAKLYVRGQRRPAAAHLNGGIAQQRFFDALISAVVENRIGGKRQRRCRTCLGCGRRPGGCARLLRRLCSSGRGCMSRALCGSRRKLRMRDHRVRIKQCWLTCARRLRQRGPCNQSDYNANDKAGPHESPSPFGWIWYRCGGIWTRRWTKCLQE